MTRFCAVIVVLLLVLTAILGWTQTADVPPRQTPGAQNASALLPVDGVHSKEEEPDAARPLVSACVRRLAADQRQFWTSPFQLRRHAAFESLLPFGGISAGLIAGDRSIEREVPTTAGRRSQNISSHATLSLVAGAAGAYGLGRLTHNDHLRETGLLSGEAVVNGILITTVLQRAIGRERPYQGNGEGAFFQGGTSFPSQHAVMAWSVASVVAHEYPGALSKILAYGLASSVSVTRVSGRQHFAADVFVGSALGWYLGRQIYRARHDASLGGSSWGELENDSLEQSPQPPERMGSDYVPLDSWVYPAIERLAAFGYIRTAFLGLKPWTRMECARLVEQSEESMQSVENVEAGATELQFRLKQEFSPEFELFEGGRNRTARLESIYLRTVSISGPPLTDGNHFGQTLAYDYGRPFRRGINTQMGATFRAALGPAAVFVQAEFQHSPSAPALSESVRNFMATADQVPASAATPFPAIDRPRLLNAYVALNLREGWQLSFGKQSLSWGPGPGGSFLWSNNIEPIPMLRLTHSAAQLPGLLRVLGPVRTESFFGRLDGHSYIPHPYIYGNKINFKPLPNLELGFGRTVTIGGRGGDPLTAKNFLLSFFGQTSSQLHSVPGDSNTSFDWTFHVPKVRNYLVFYGDWYADDDFVPFQNPPKNPYRPGVYVTRFPGLPKLDFHLEAASTESPWFANHGNLNYWNYKYRDGYTNNGNLIGNTVGRMGRSIQCWFNYWISPENVVQFAYKHNSVSRDFVPQGGAWQDYSVRHEISFRSGLYVKSQVQFEHISRYPMLFPGSRNNVTAVMELGFVPHRGR